MSDMKVPVLRCGKHGGIEITKEWLLRMIPTCIGQPFRDENGVLIGTVSAAKVEGDRLIVEVDMLETPPSAGTGGK